MKTIRLGKTELRVPIIGFGGIPIQRLTENEAIKVVQRCLDLGVRFLDTANSYTTSEERIGKAIVGCRDHVIIATKFGHIVDEQRKVVYADDDKIITNLQNDVENSLRRLNTDYIDLYQLHAPRVEPEPALEVRGMLEDLVQQGLIRWYGWSTDLVDRAIIFADGEHCTSIQFRLNALFDNVEMRDLCD